MFFNKRSELEKSILKDDNFTSPSPILNRVFTPEGYCFNLLRIPDNLMRIKHWLFWSLLATASAQSQVNYCRNFARLQEPSLHDVLDWPSNQTCPAGYDDYLMHLCRMQRRALEAIPVYQFCLEYCNLSVEQSGLALTALLVLLSLLLYCLYLLNKPLDIIEVFEKNYQHKINDPQSFENRLENIEYDFHQLPQQFTDCISLSIINDPVRVNNKYIHDRKPLFFWWRKGNKTLPLSPSEAIESIEPDGTLKKELEAFVSQMEMEYSPIP